MDDVELSRAVSQHIVSFGQGSAENPYNWSRTKKLAIVAVGTLAVLNSTIASSLPSGAGPQLQAHFDVQSDAQLVLPNSVFLIGYIVGPIFWAPLSESYGRRLVTLGTFFGFAVFMMATALAPTWAGFLVFRFLTGMFASAPIAITGGLYADLYNTHLERGRAIAWLMVVSTIGPASGPVPTGYLVQYSWRWPFWFGLIFAGVTAVPLSFLPETFGPALLRAKAKKLRAQQPGAKIYAPLDLKQTTTRDLITKVIGRPLRMMVTEPIVAACCLFLSLLFAVLFMLFQAFALIFPPIYGFTQGETGLAFIPISVGSVFALPLYLWWDRILRNAKERNAAWSHKEEYRRLPLGCLGGPIFTASMFMLGWTARPSIHWIAPLLAGLPMGLGLVLVFIAFITYMTDSYGIYSASALGAASMARSVFGVVVPFSTNSMYGNLGIAWACSLLGFLSVLMCSFPFLLIKFGAELREKSPMCKELRKQNAHTEKS